MSEQMSPSTLDQCLSKRFFLKATSILVSSFMLLIVWNVTLHWQTKSQNDKYETLNKLVLKNQEDADKTFKEITLPRIHDHQKQLDNLEKKVDMLRQVIAKPSK